MTPDELLASYPRERPPLPPKQAAIYADEYKKNRQGKGLMSRLAQGAEGWMHERVAAGGIAGPVLELGAGTLNHVPHESPHLGEWGLDIVEPQEHLYADSPHRSAVRDVFADIADVPSDRRYSRIISVAVLEHVADLPAVLERCRDLLAPGGLMQHGIPSEGGFLWGLGWRLTTGLSYRLRTGFSYKTLMRHEHLSSADEILTVFRHIFPTATVDRFPTPTRHGSLYAYLEATRP
ncbi:MAG: class I SAM-dependent methyltransferase [Planctomycetota bacterium]